MRTRPVTVLVTSLLLGCSDDGGGGADATQSTSTDTSVAETSTDTQSATATDVAVETTSEVVSTPVDETVRFTLEGSPLVGIMVDRFDATGRSVEQLETDARGEVTFRGVDYADGGLTITWLGGPAIDGGIVGAQADELERVDGVIALYLVRRGTPRVGGITLSGQALGMSDTDHSLAVIADLPGAPASNKKGASWEIEGLPADRAIDLVAHEWSNGPEAGPRSIDQRIAGWTTATSVASAVDAEVVLDFGAPLASETLSGTFVGPTGVSLDAEGTGVVSVLARRDRDLGGILGVTTRSVRGVEGLVSYTVEWVEPTWADDVATIYRLVSTREVSLVQVNGWPSEATMPTLPAPPVLEAPSTSPMSVTEPVRWSGVAPDALAFLELYTGSADARVHVARYIVHVGSEVVLPPLPGGVPVPVLMGGQVAVRVGSCELAIEGTYRYCRRLALSRFGVLAP
ncbi:MAG: hypothetical protein IT385_05090 [Deltaproteobacteria bacterium]|nr:hypothetical protein [Deltaproteobacteria bacterium]